MTDKEIVERAKEAEKRSGFGELVHSPISKGVNSAFGIGFIEGMVEYRNSMQKEPASGNIDFEQELYKSFGQVKDFTLGMQIAKWFYDMGKNSQEPVSEELDEAASSFARKDSEGISNSANFYYTVADKARIFKSGAKWQIARLMKDAIDVTVHIDAGSYPYIPQMELYDYDKDAPLAKEGDKYKVILIKEE